MPFSTIHTEKGGATQRLDFESEEITIGRVDENDICLPKGNISKKHTKIVVKDGKIIVLDLKSTNGTYVNGKKLAGPQVITPTDKVYIGDFILNVEPPDMAGGEEQPADEVDGQPTMSPQLAEEPTDQPAYEGEDATRREGYPEEEPPPEEEALPEAEPEPEPEPEPELPPEDEESIPTPVPVKKAPPGKTAPPPSKPAPAAAKGPLAGAKAAAAAAAAKPAPAFKVSKTGKKKGAAAAAANVSEEYAQTLNLVHDRLIE